MTKIVGVGHATLDVFFQATKKEIESLGLSIGAVKLIDEEFVNNLVNKFKMLEIKPGGAIANMLDIIALLNGDATICAAFSSDEWGGLLQNDWQARGIKTLPIINNKKHTSRCYTLIDENKERTFATFFGASGDIYENDIKNFEESFLTADYVLLEGYLWDSPNIANTYKYIGNMVKTKNSTAKLVFATCDHLLLKRAKDDLIPFIIEYADLVIANELEFISLMQTNNVDNAIAKATKELNSFAVTMGERGCCIKYNNEISYHNTRKVTQVVDMTGAGDAWAGGFLYAISNDYSVDKAVQLANDMAAKVITQIGARIAEL